MYIWQNSPQVVNVTLPLEIPSTPLTFYERWEQCEQRLAARHLSYPSPNSPTCKVCLGQAFQFCEWWKNKRQREKEMKCGISFSIFFFSWSFSTSSCKWQASSHLRICMLKYSGMLCQRKMTFIAVRCPGAGRSAEVSVMLYTLQLTPKRARTYRKHMRKTMKGVCSNKQTNKHKRFRQEATFLCVCMCVSVKSLYTPTVCHSVKRWHKQKDRSITSTYISMNKKGQNHRALGNIWCGSTMTLSHKRKQKAIWF